MAECNFRRDGVKPYVPGESLPAGEYPVVIVDSDYYPNSTGSGYIFKLLNEVIEGEHRGRQMGAFFNDVEATRKDGGTFNHGKAQIEGACRAAGIPEAVLQDTCQLHNIPLVMVVAPRRDDPAKMEVKGYKAYGKQQAAPAPRPQAAPPPPANGSTRTRPNWTR